MLGSAGLILQVGNIKRYKSRSFFKISLDIQFRI